MSDALLYQTDRQEALSWAYVCAIAAAAGYATARPDFDRDSIDMAISAGGNMRPVVHAQLKATINLRASGNVFKFKLKKKNYDDLRIATTVPRIVIVLAMPRQEADWLNVSIRQLVMKRAAVWGSLRGKPEVENKDTVTIELSKDNRFDVDSLKAMMERARSGSIL